MPIYEYQCLDCHQDFEKLVTFGHKEAVACPHCHGYHVDKQLSTFGAKISRGKNSLAEGKFSSSAGCGSCTSKNCSTCR
ncbi:MAG: zinc ribbon domain-containing protein [bacterium]